MPTSFDNSGHDYYVNEFREYKKGYQSQKQLRSECDPLFLIITLVRLFVALGRVLFGIAGWLVRTARGKR